MLAYPNHVAFLSDNLKAGGIQKLVITRCEYLIKQQYKVDIVLLKKTGAFLDLVPKNARLIKISKRNRFADLVNYVKTEQPNFIVASSIDSLLAGLFLKIKFRKKINLIICIDTMYTKHLELCKKRKEKTLVKNMRILKWLCFLSDKIIIISNTMLDDFIKFNIFPIKNKIVFNYPSIDIELIKKLQLEQVDNPWFADKDCKIILSAGRMVANKNQDLLLHALVFIRKKYNAKLIILGDGILKNELIELSKKLNIEAHVSFPGNLLNPYAHMYNSDVFALSSIIEGFPITYLESIACGTTVVSTDFSSFSDFVELLDLDNTKYKCIEPIKDVQAFANAIISVLDNPISSDILIEKSKIFSIDKLMPKFSQILQDSIYN